MLVYANKFVFEPKNGTEQIIQLVAKWVGQRARQRVDAERLAEGIRELRLKDGSTLTSRATINVEKNPTYPYVFCAQLSHGDDMVSGRRWVTEVGLRQEGLGNPIECSVLLKTDEVSARVRNPIQVTRPKLVAQLIQECSPIGQTPGLSVKRLNEESARAFLHEVERDEREHPIVLISCDKDGLYPVEPERLRSILVGLSDVVEVPASVDTFAIEEIVGRRYIAFGGAINVVFPSRKGDRGWFCETVLFRPTEIIEFLAEGKTIESEVLAAITHRTNLPYSWRHISLEMVSQAVLRTQLAQMLERARESDNSEELGEYIALLESADQELIAKDAELARIRSEYKEKEREARKLQADIANLKHALSGRQASEDNQDDEVVEALAPLRESITAVLRGNPSLQQALELTSSLYAERIVVLDAAINSAKESDRGGFRFGDKAFELLSKLANEYWQALADGKGDQHAKAAFGHNAYAQNEGQALSGPGKQRRTFSYHGKTFLMEKHLKSGVKDSLAETLRIHFEWVAEEKRLVIGHCGKHLDF
jgi:hypothetical protein